MSKMPKPTQNPRPANPKRVIANVPNAQAASQPPRAATPKGLQTNPPTAAITTQGNKVVRRRTGAGVVVPKAYKGGATQVTRPRMKGRAGQSASGAAGAS